MNVHSYILHVVYINIGIYVLYIYYRHVYSMELCYTYYTIVDDDDEYYLKPRVR